MAKRKTRLEQLGLMRTTVPAETNKVILKRVEPFRKLHLQGPNLSVFGMPAAVERFGNDCYLQGLIDGAGVATRDPRIIGDVQFPADGKGQ